MGVSLVDFGGISAVSLFLANLKICGNVITCLQIILTKFSFKFDQNIVVHYGIMVGWTDRQTDRQTDRRTDRHACFELLAKTT